MIGLLTSPDAFFRERAENPGLRGPLLVVTVVAVLGAVAAYPFVQAFMSALPEGRGILGSVILVASLAGALFGPYVIWLVYAGGFHIISAVAFDGEGGFRRTVALTGWGFVPAILNAAIGVVVAFLVWNSVAVPDLSDPARVQAFVQEIRNRPAFLISSLLGLVFLLWQALLWAFAVQHGRKLSLRNAAITVAVPVAVAAAFRINGLL